jgi:uncharacterized hydrophobic protein (TIGR00271 family)
MVHLRILAPEHLAHRALDVLDGNESVCNIVVLPGAARRPRGDVILCDVAREDASVVLADLRELGVHREGSISLEDIDTQISELTERAVEAARGAPADAVVWEEVEARTNESASLSFSFVLFMVLAGMIAAVAIYLDSEILMVGAMVVGPEFGPIAGFCVAAVQRRRLLALRSFLALAVGFPAVIGAALVLTLIFQATGVTPDEFTEADHGLAAVIANPNFLAFFVAFCGGAAGVLSLSTSKSAALIGVFISVTTLPAATNIGVAAAYGQWASARGSAEQLVLNLAGILLAGTLTLSAQRALYARRRRRHLRSRGAAPGRATRPEGDAGAPAARR